MFLWQEQQEARHGWSGCRKLGTWTRKKGGRGGKAKTLVHTIHPHMCKNTLKNHVYLTPPYMCTNTGTCSYTHVTTDILHMFIHVYTQICTYMYTHILIH